MNTINSGEENRDSLLTSKHVPPTNLVAFLPYACGQLQVDIVVQVHVRSQEEYVSRASKPQRSKLYRPSTVAAGSSSAGVAAASAPDVPSEEPAPQRAFVACVPVTATVDAVGRVHELEVVRARVPRALLQVLALATPYNPSLARLALRRCRLRGDVLHELAKPTFATLTDLCLDGSPVPEANYATLLDGACGHRLRRLSLARVRLDDDECGELAARLQYARPAGRSLRVLDLASNAVGDAGAAALARALRTNRTLLHLNLADNRVSDDGATELLRSFTPFLLTEHELRESRRRLVAHLRAVLGARPAQAPRLLERGRRATTQLPGRGPRRTSRAGSVPDVQDERAAARTAALLNSFEDPFGPSETVCVAGRIYCSGNRVLCYLNVAHNRLSSVTAGRLARALEAQRVTEHASLLRVVLEGNPLPSARVSAHMAHVDELLERAVTAAGRADASQRRPARVRTVR